MLKLLIVEDEKATRKGLLANIDWGRFGITEIAEAADGLEGLATAKQIRPDIVISDIRMPGLSGIELAQRLVAELPKCRIIFLSGHSDKEYLKAAIRFGVVSYVEKPIDLHELQEAISLAARKCSEKQEAQPGAPSLEELVRGVLLGQPNDEVLHALARRLAADTAAPSYVVLLLSSQKTPQQKSKLLKAAQRALRSYPRVCGMLGSQCAAIVSGIGQSQLRKAAADVFSSVRRLYGGPQVFCAVGPCVNDLSGLQESYAGAAKATERLFFLGYGRLVFSADALPGQSDLNAYDVGTFLRLLQDGQWEGIHTFVGSLHKQTMRQDHACEAQIKDLFLKYSFALFREAERRDIQLSQNNPDNERFFWNVLFDSETMDALCGAFLQLIDQAEHAFKHAEDHNRIISQAIKIIQAEYGNPQLSVKMLSAGVYLTQPYLSYLFKKVTGKTASDYIAEYRMEQAKQLLLNGNLKLWEIAGQVGYTDANYFSKIFKRLTGITPSAFRTRYVS